MRRTRFRARTDPPKYNPLGTRRAKIERSMSRIDRITSQMEGVNEKFTKVIQASQNNAQQIRYAIDDFTSAASRLQEKEDTAFLGDWMKKTAKQIKHTNEQLNILNQKVMAHMMATAEKFIKEEFPDIKVSKKNFDKICATADGAKTKFVSSKKKGQEKKIAEAKAEWEQQKEMKDLLKKGLVTQLEETEERIYCESIRSLMAVPQTFTEFYEEGIRYFKRPLLDAQSGEIEFQKHLATRNSKKEEKKEKEVKEAEVQPAPKQKKLLTTQSDTSVQSVNENEQAKQKEMFKRSLNIISTHLSDSQSEIELRQDPLRAMVETLSFDEKKFQHEFLDFIYMCKESLTNDSSCSSKISATEVQDIFCNFDDIQKAHTSILKQVNECKVNWSRNYFFKIFLKVIKEVKVYLPFTDKYTVALARIDLLCQRSKHLNHLLLASEKPLGSLLQKLDEKLDFYHSFLLQLKAFDLNENDQDVLKRVEEIMGDYQRYVGNQRGDKESMKLLLDFQDQLEDYDGPPLENVKCRKVIKVFESMVMEIQCFDEAVAAPKSKFHVLLCDDILVCAKKGKKLKYHVTLQLNQFAFTMPNREEKYVLQMKEEETNFETCVLYFLRSNDEMQEVKTILVRAFELVLQKKVIGVALSALMEAQGPGNFVPKLLDTSIRYLVSSGAIKKEGLMRISASTSDILAVTKELNAGTLASFEGVDPFVVGCIFKKFFRELPDSVFTKAKFEDFLEAAEKEDPLTHFRLLIEGLPLVNQFVLQQSFSFFSLLASYQDENKMTSQNIAIVMAPIMLPPPKLDAASIARQGESISVIKELIDNVNVVFGKIKAARRNGALLNKSIPL